MGLIYRTLTTAGVVLAIGCSDRPSAPVLTVEAVYRHDASGLRFLTPDGWAPLARVDLPVGRLDKPTRMVAFVNTTASASQIELYAVNLPPETNLVSYLNTVQKIGPEQWQVKTPPAETEIRGVKASRFGLQTAPGKPLQRREVVVFRRGERQFLFVFTGRATASGDAEAFNRCVASVTWD